MPKDKLTDYSATNASNTDVGGVNIDEGMLPSAVNNALREILTHLKQFSDGTDGIDVLSLADDDASAAMKLQAPASVTSDTTLTLPDGDGDSGQTLITNGSGTLAWAAPYGNRNLIINGAMQVAQRGDSTGVTSSGYHGPDRFKLTASSIGTYSISQSTDAPSGFSHSYKLDCTTADASPAAGDFLIVYHFVEAQNTTAIKSGTSDAQPMTLSFWVKSNETGTYAMNIRQVDGGKFSNNTYTINAADTWEKKTLTFPANTADTITYDNTSGFQLEWWLDSGSNFKGGTSSTAWHTQDNTDRNADSTVAIADSTSNEWYITGVQLEVGEQATPFEHRSFGDELQKCRRYYEQWDATDGRYLASGYYNATNQSLYAVQMRAEKRAAPTVSFAGTASNFLITRPGTSTASAGTKTADDIGVSMFKLNSNSNPSTHTTGQASFLGVYLDSIIKADAEL